MRAYIESLESLSKSQLVLLLARQRMAQTEGLAVVGLSCRLPGGIDDPAGLWAAVRDGTALATEHAGPPTDSLGRPRWNLSAPDIAPWAGALVSGAYLPDIDLFDAAGFGIPDEEASCLDPQQRLLLAGARRALDDAALGDLAGRRTGIFVSLASSEYGLAGIRNGVPGTQVSPHITTGTTTSAAAGRIATALGLSGPALTVDTACSSTLVATHLAGAALRSGECDIAVVGACQLLLSPISTGLFAMAGMLSKAGRCRPFTARADGYVRGEGCVVFVLVRERDAEAGGHTPYAVIRGSAVHQHGGRASMISPSSVGQQRAIRECLRAADVSPEAVGYVEAHGSGDKVADGIEIDALAAAYGRDRAGSAPLLVGSGKPNLGYLETVSGAAGLLRAVLALHERTVPAQPDFGDPAPGIPWHRMSLTVPTESMPWPAWTPSQRTLAGVNSFGLTGTNAHVLLEAAQHPRSLNGHVPERGQRHWLDACTWH